MLKKKVSVIIPVYNCSKYIEKCIESILFQTYSNIEVIVVNDGSTDDIISKLAKYSSKVSIISKENGGVSSARNAGILSAQGEYIMFVDGDDWIDSNMIQTMIESFTKENQIVHCGLVKESSQFVNQMNISNEKKVLNKKEVFNIMINNYLLSQPVCQLIPKKIIKEMFNTSINIGEDFLFNCHLYSNIDEIIYLPECFYHYRLVNDSAVHSLTFPKIEKKCEDMIIVYCKLYDFAKIWKISDQSTISQISCRIIKELNMKLLQVFQSSNINKTQKKQLINKYSIKIKEKNIRNFILAKDLFKQNKIYFIPFICLYMNTPKLYYLFGQHIYKWIYFIKNRRNL